MQNLQNKTIDELIQILMEPQDGPAEGSLMAVFSDEELKEIGTFPVNDAYADLLVDLLIEVKNGRVEICDDTERPMSVLEIIEKCDSDSQKSYRIFHLPRTGYDEDWDGSRISLPFRHPKTGTLIPKRTTAK